MGSGLRTERGLCALGRGHDPPGVRVEPFGHGERLAKVVESGRRARRSGHGALNTWPRDTEPMEDSMPRKPTPSERYWSKVKKTETCWVWTGRTRERGTGLFKMGGRKHAAHRLMFESVYGQLQGHVAVWPTCGVPRCVRPEHLAARPQRNRLEAQTGSLTPTGCCAHGRPFTPDSLFVHPPDGRGCGECIALYPPRHPELLALDLNTHPERVNSEAEDEGS